MDFSDHSPTRKALGIQKGKDFRCSSSEWSRVILLVGEFAQTDSKIHSNERTGDRKSIVNGRLNLCLVIKPVVTVLVRKLWADAEYPKGGLLNWISWHNDECVNANHLGLQCCLEDKLS